MTPDTVTRMAPIVGGVTTRFTFTTDYGILVEFFPMLPHLRSGEERRRFHLDLEMSDAFFD